jgi:hypothetical protein
MGALALEGVAIGFAFSVLLAAAVYLVAHRAETTLPADAASVAVMYTAA